MSLFLIDCADIVKQSMRVSKQQDYGVKYLWVNARIKMQQTGGKLKSVEKQ